MKILDRVLTETSMGLSPQWPVWREMRGPRTILWKEMYLKLSKQLTTRGHFEVVRPWERQHGQGTITWQELTLELDDRSVILVLLNTRNLFLATFCGCCSLTSIRHRHTAIGYYIDGKYWNSHWKSAILLFFTERQHRIPSRSINLQEDVNCLPFSN